MAAGDLTTLANVKAYSPGLETTRQGTDDTFDALLARLITAVSDQFRAEAGTDPVLATYTETRNGHGRNAMTLNHGPVVAVTSVKVDGTTIPARPSVSGDGWVLDGDRVLLVGSVFTDGTGNVEFTYSAGYATIPGDLEQAVIKMVCLQFQDRKRIGVASSSIAGESTSFNSDGSVLAYWRSVVESYRVQAI